MQSPRPSLLDRSPPLPGLALDDLTPDERAQGEGRAEHPCGEFSAARFFALYPDRYAMIARALAEGFSLEAAARVFRVHERTAAAIREREARSLDAEAYRGIQARHARGVVLAATDEIARRLREAPDQIGVRDLVAAVRELHNVERSLEGAPSQVLGVIRADGASAALAELLDQARAARPDGFGRAGKASREAAGQVVDAEAVPVIDGPQDAARIPAIDSQSSPQSTQSTVFARVPRDMDTAQDATRGGQAAVDGDAAVAPGGSGGRDARGAGGVPAQQGGHFR